MLLENIAYRPVAKQEAVVRAARNPWRGDIAGDRAPILLHLDRVPRAGNDDEVPVRGPFQDVAALVAQISSDPATDVRPALRHIRVENSVGRFEVGVIQSHRLVQPAARELVPSPPSFSFCREILR